MAESAGSLAVINSGADTIILSRIIHIGMVAYGLCDGYIYVLKREDPCANASGYVPQHRLVYAEANNLTLKDLEEYDIHHINTIKTDNRIENLQLVTQAGHNSIHKKGKRRSSKARKKISDSLKRVWRARRKKQVNK
jgi:hypothetical protein